MTEWISVKKALPSEDGLYEVCYEATDLSERSCGREYFISGAWIFQPPVFNLDIIYWKPLPEPPKD